MAVFGDYTMNVVVSHAPNTFTPMTTAFLTIVVGTPVTYYLMNQHFDLRLAMAKKAALEVELTAAVEAAQMASIAKSDFLANMTHELRTPLNAIIGFAAILGRSNALSPEDARYVALVNNASQALRDIINDVLDYSKLEADGIEFERLPMDPVDIVRSTAMLLADQAAAKGLELSVCSSGAQSMVLGDQSRIRQVVLNLLSNAIKFTAAGRIGVGVDVQIEGGLAHIRVEVEDAGIGLPPDHPERLFKRFSQADATVTRQFGGTGLGLAISKRIVEGLGGDIGARNNIAGGATFWFEVTAPVIKEADGGVDVAPAVLSLDRPARILIVDDNAHNRELIIALLSPFDVDIQTACDGVEAIAANEREAFDIILMDIQMPNLDGISATERIRAAELTRGRRTPIIAMTANVLPEQIARCLSVGMDGHLGKPIAPEAVLRTIALWVAQSA